MNTIVFTMLFTYCMENVTSRVVQKYLITALLIVVMG